MSPLLAVAGNESQLYIGVGSCQADSSKLKIGPTNQLAGVRVSGCWSLDNMARRNISIAVQLMPQVSSTACFKKRGVECTPP